MFCLGGRRRRAPVVDDANVVLVLSPCAALRSCSDRRRLSFLACRGDVFTICTSIESSSSDFKLAVMGDSVVYYRCCMASPVGLTETTTAVLTANQQCYLVQISIKTS